MGMPYPREQRFTIGPGVNHAPPWSTPPDGLWEAVARGQIMDAMRDADAYDEMGLADYDVHADRILDLPAIREALTAVAQRDAAREQVAQLSARVDWLRGALADTEGALGQASEQLAAACTCNDFGGDRNCPCCGDASPTEPRCVQDRSLACVSDPEVCAEAAVCTPASPTEPRETWDEYQRRILTTDATAYRPASPTSPTGDPA